MNRRAQVYRTLHPFIQRFKVGETKGKLRRAFQSAHKEREMRLRSS